jgi:hypothetical protein
MAKAKSTSARTATPGSIAQENPPLTAEERYRMIAEAAYFRAEKRGFLGGNVAEDWLEAEAEIDRMLREQGRLPSMTPEEIEQRVQGTLATDPAVIAAQVRAITLDALTRGPPRHRRAQTRDGGRGQGRPRRRRAARGTRRAGAERGDARSGRGAGRGGGGRPARHSGGRGAHRRVLPAGAEAGGGRSRHAADAVRRNAARRRAGCPGRRPGHLHRAGRTCPQQRLGPRPNVPGSRSIN